MPAPALYLETTIPSYLVARLSRDVRLAADQLSTREWWDECRHDYELFTSQIVLDEVQRGDPAFAAARREQSAGVTLLRNISEAAELAKRAPAGSNRPGGCRRRCDTHRIGRRTRDGVSPYLELQAHQQPQNPLAVERACEAAGLLCPDICTPAELMRA